MSSSSLSSIPDSIIFLDEAVKDFLALDRHQQIRVIKALQKIARSPDSIGKPLGNRVGYTLTGFRSIYVDEKRLRIIWRASEKSDTQIVLIIAIAERKGLLAYELASQRRKKKK